MNTTADLRAAAKLVQQLEETRDAHARTLRRLEKAKGSRQELVDAVYQAAKDAALAMPTPAAIKAPAKGKPGDQWALLHLTDWQLGKKTRSYSSDITVKRIERCVQKALRITELQRHAHGVSSAALLLGGDMVEGTAIFPSQAWQVDAGLYDQLFTTAGLIERSVRTFLAEFDRVEVWDEYGNHGRIGKYGEQPAEDNVDRMAYRIAQDRIGAHPRLVWHPVQSFYNRGVIGNYSFLLVHGDEIRGFGGNLPAFGIKRKCIAWASGVVEPFKDVYMGHWHTPDVYALPAGGRIFVAPSPESGNDHAREFVGATGVPGQRLNFVDPAAGMVTSENVLWLDKAA